MCLLTPLLYFSKYMYSDKQTYSVDTKCTQSICQSEAAACISLRMLPSRGLLRRCSLFGTNITLLTTSIKVYSQFKQRITANTDFYEHVIKASDWTWILDSGASVLNSDRFPPAAPTRFMNIIQSKKRGAVTTKDILQQLQQKYSITNKSPACTIYFKGAKTF